jgi:hypothetical protein
MGEILSDKTLSGYSNSEISNTASDMEEAFRWHIGDPEPTGTHAKANVSLKAYRDDMRRGQRNAESYTKNYILIDTLKPINEQLKQFKRG